MSRVYLIGGAPRVGKSTALLRFLSTQRPMMAASTDAIRDVIRGVLKKEDYPLLFKTALGTMGSPSAMRLMREAPEAIIGHHVEECLVTWKSVERFIDTNKNNSWDVAVEGVAILPSRIANLSDDYHTVFMVNREDQTKVLRSHARKHSYDWLNRYPEEFIDTFSHYLHALNEYYFSQAQRYGIPVIQIHNDTFNADLDQVVSALGKHTI